MSEMKAMKADSVDVHVDSRIEVGIFSCRQQKYEVLVYDPDREWNKL